MLSRLWFILLTVPLLLCGGCSDDDPFGLPAGTIQITVIPDHLDAAWTLTGPADIERDGHGSANLDDMIVGEYTVIWADMTGWITPAISTGDLDDGGTLLLAGAYEQHGMIVITPLPDGFDARWLLTGPADFEREGHGNANLDDMVAGEYTVTWADTTGWITPPIATGNLDGGATLLLSGTYVQQGTITITPLPDGLDAPWLLTGPDGYSLAGSGAETVEFLDPGDYTLDWGDLNLWSPPETSTQTLVAGGTLDFEGEYVPVFAIAETSNEAMTFFREAYCGRFLEFYEHLLSEDFLFVERDGGITNLDTELAIANKMFNGIAGQNNFVIADITVDVLDPQGVWTPTPSNDPDFGMFPASMYRTYIVHMEFVIQGENLTLLVDGPVTFFVMNEGTDSPDFKFLGMRDLTHGDSKGTESITWSGVKSLFE